MMSQLTARLHSCAVSVDVIDEQRLIPTVTSFQLFGGNQTGVYTEKVEQQVTGRYQYIIYFIFLHFHRNDKLTKPVYKTQ